MEWQLSLVTFLAGHLVGMNAQPLSGQWEMV